MLEKGATDENDLESHLTQIIYKSRLFRNFDLVPTAYKDRLSRVWGFPC